MNCHGAHEAEERTALLQDSSDSKSVPYESYQDIEPIIQDSTPGSDATFTKRLIRNIDRRLLTIMFITFNFNFIDKTVLTSASVYGLTTDINLSGSRYAWVSSVFYVGYFIWEYPTTILIQKLPVAKYTAAAIIAWGCVVAATSFSTTYSQLLVARFFTGALEATISPAFLYITAMWYTRNEAPSRMGVWYAGNSCGGAIANLLSWAIGHIEGEMRPWRWMYIIFGLSTLVWGFFVLLLLPDTVATANFLKPGERLAAESRVAHTGTGITTSEQDDWSFKEALKCLLDPKTWFFFLIALLTQIPNGGFQTFVNLMVKGFGFTSYESSLVLIPISFISLSMILGSGWLATKYQDITTILISTLTIPPIVGNVLMCWGTSRGVKLAGLYTISFAHGIIPLTLSLISGNVRSVTQKMTMTALILIAFCAGNIIGPQLFLASETPRYPTAFKLIALCYALASLSSLGLRVYLGCVNRRWEKEERPSTPATPILEFRADGEGEEPEVVVVEQWERVVVRGFRYRL